MRKLVAKISRGKLKGNDLFPYQHANEQNIASTSRFEIDYV